MPQAQICRLSGRTRLTVASELSRDVDVAIAIGGCVGEHMRQIQARLTDRDIVCQLSHSASAAHHGQKRCLGQFQRLPGESEMERAPRDFSALQSVPGEGIEERRRRMALLQAEAVEQRQRELAEQSSPLNSASIRIKAWERLHQVDLPSNPAHRLVTIIAANTGLSIDEVRDEQSLRAAPSK